jgi:hypothetical protein
MVFSCIWKVRRVFIVHRKLSSFSPRPYPCPHYDFSEKNNLTNKPLCSPPTSPFNQSIPRFPHPRDSLSVPVYSFSEQQQQQQRMVWKRSSASLRAVLTVCLSWATVEMSVDSALRGPVSEDHERESWKDVSQSRLDADYEWWWEKDAC